MDKIICSLEDWDSIFNYYRPNGSSKTWYIKELKRLSIPLMWGDWNILTEDGEMFGQGFLEHAITPQHSNLIEYTPKENLKGSSHIYIINIYNSSFFKTNRNLGFDCISSEYLEDIRNGKSKILMLFIYEGYSGTHNNFDFEIIEEWRIKSNLPVNSIYYVCGNLLSENIVKEKNLGYKARGVHYFEPWNSYNGDLVDFIPHETKYLYLSYNRTYRPQRLILLWHLHQVGLLDKGLISFNNIKRDSIPSEVNPEFIEYLSKMLPIKINPNYDLYYNLAVNITKEDYESTFISLVSESLVDDGTLFFSEKIWKPIMVGHPFVLYGNKGSLEYLKKLGYRTYDKWIDESYDNENDRNFRSFKIIEQIKKFESKSIEELKEIREEMKEVCEFNKEHYKKLYQENYGISDKSQIIEKILCEIWDEINTQGGQI